MRRDAHKVPLGVQATSQETERGVKLPEWDCETWVAGCKAHIIARATYLLADSLRFPWVVPIHASVVASLDGACDAHPLSSLA